MDVVFSSNNSSAKPSKQMTMVKNPPVIQPIPQPEKTITPPPAAPPQTAQSPVMPQQVSMDDVSKKLDSIEERNQANVDKLSSQVNELQNVIANLEARLNSLNNTTQDLVMQQEKAAAKKAAKLNLLNSLLLLLNRFIMFEH
jgi:molecular chaperone GrpE (heat shock protein)